MNNQENLHKLVQENFNNVRWVITLPAIIILLLFSAYFIFQEGDFQTTYTQMQIPLFLDINHTLSALPRFEYNLTNLGNALVGLSLLSIFLYYSPKLWGALINASLLSLLLTYPLKKLFEMPRPASVIELSDFTIIGRTLLHKSFPSGHSITIFIFITVLLLAFMPRMRSSLGKWFSFGFPMILLGLFIAASRVACGAHWPLDVLIGSTIGYLLAVIGVQLDNKYPVWRWMDNDKYKWIVLVIVLVLLGLMISKVIKHSLLTIDLLAILSLVVTAILLIKKICSKKICSNKI